MGGPADDTGCIVRRRKGTGARSKRAIYFSSRGGQCQISTSTWTREAQGKNRAGLKKDWPNNYHGDWAEGTSISQVVRGGGGGGGGGLGGGGGWGGGNGLLFYKSFPPNFRMRCKREKRRFRF